MAGRLPYRMNNRDRHDAILFTCPQTTRTLNVVTRER